MKITFCLTHIITGGIETTLLQMLERLSGNPKYKFTIIVEKPITEKIFVDFFNAKGIKVHVLDCKQINFDKKNTHFILKFFYKLINKFGSIMISV